MQLRRIEAMLAKAKQFTHSKLLKRLVCIVFGSYDLSPENIGIRGYGIVYEGEWGGTRVAVKEVGAGTSPRVRHD
jgi:hypothetical protein